MLPHLRPRAELYTRPELRDFAGRYYSAEDVGALEGQPPFNFMPPPAKH